MRKVVAGLMVTANGIYDGEESWSGAYMSEEFGRAIGELMMAGDAIVMGRKTYESLFASFSEQEGGQADMMNNTKKYVVSDTLEAAEWNNSTLIAGDDLENALNELKEADGANINITGSGTLVRSLIERGLLDELSLFVFPLARAEGKNLWEGLDTDVALKVKKTENLPNGVVHLAYLPG